MQKKWESQIKQTGAPLTQLALRKNIHTPPNFSSALANQLADISTR